MKESRIRVIVFLMAAAVTGLIAVQIYWISSAFGVEQQKFRSTVNDAISATIKKLDKRETASVIIDKIVNDDDDVKVIRLDTIRPHMYLKVDSAKAGKGYSLNYRVKSKGGIDSITSKLNYFTWTDDDTLKKDVKFFVSRSKLDSVIVRKRKNVDQIFNQLLNVEPGKPIKKRINEKALGKILKEELGSRGITAEYDWGVRVADTDTILFASGEIAGKLRGSEFQARLFPDDLFGIPNFLTLYFPSEKTYVLRNLSLMLSVSAALIILVIFLFYRTINLLLAQKRIAEIKNDLINNITHEFKTPISTISLASESLSEKEILGSSESVKRYSKIISEENNRLRGMVENLLNTAVIERGDFHLDKRETDIHKIIESIVEKYSAFAGAAGGSVKANLGAEHYLVNADAFHITGVINNLVDNAVKFSGDSPEVTVSTEDSGEGIKISVSDRGIGIEKSNLSRVFETFYRVPTGDVHNVKGYGIGLSYAKKMVEAHGGKITVDSRPGSGSTFVILLPG